MSVSSEDLLKLVYERIPIDEQLYNSYEYFIEDFKKCFDKTKVLKQLNIMKNRIECAENILNEFREKIEKEISNIVK